jgi:hypothetical protein
MFVFYCCTPKKIVKKDIHLILGRLFRAAFHGKQYRVQIATKEFLHVSLLHQHPEPFKRVTRRW